MDSAYQSAISKYIHGINVSSQSADLQTLDKAASVIALGVRKIVLEEIKQESIGEFETIFQEKGDVGVLEYGFAHIPHFSTKLELLTKKVMSAIHNN